MRTRLLPALLIAPLLASAGCSDQQLNSKDNNGNSGTTEDGPGTTGDTGPNYESGCILVDGEGGYAWINDAIAVASPGSTIELCATQGDDVHEEAVVVDKAVHIIGPGVDNFILQPPANEHGIQITASGASVSGISIVTTRSGVVVGASGIAEVNDVLLDDIKVLDAPNWAVSVANASDVTIQNSEFMGNTYGAVGVDGAGVNVVGSTLQNNVAFGVYVVGESEVYLEANDIIGTQATNPDYIEDGHGVYATDGSVISTNGNYFLGNVFVNVFADSADLDMVDDEVEGGLYGVVAFGGTYALDGLDLTDSRTHAALLVSTGLVSVANTVVTGDYATVADVADADWNQADEAGNVNRSGVGMLIQGEDIQISDSTFVGYNNAGAYLLSAESGTATLVRNTFVDNGRHGLWLANLQTVIEDLEVTGVIEKEEQDPADACLSVDRYAGVVAVNGSVVWNGGLLADNMGFGIVGLGAALNISGASFARNGCAGLMNFTGNLEAVGNTFAESTPRIIDNLWIESNIVDYQGTGALIRGNTFINNQTLLEEPTGITEDDEGNVSYTIYHTPFGSDIVVYESAAAEIDENVFETGTTGIQIYTSDAVISNNEWTNYLDQAFYTTGSAEVSDNMFTDVGGYAIFCSSGDISAENNVISGGGSTETSIDWYTNDELTSSYTYTSVRDSVYGSTCSLSMDGDTIENREGGGIYTYNGDATNTLSVELIDVTISSVSRPLFAYEFYGTTDIYLEGVEFQGDFSQSGVYIYQSGADSAASLTMVDSVLQGTEQYGLYLYGPNVTGDISGSTIADTTYQGIYVNGGVQLAVSDTEVSGSLGSNIQVGSSSTVSFDSEAPSVSTSAADYGITCDTTATIESCDGVDLSGNGAGEHNGCEAFCDATSTD